MRNRHEGKDNGNLMRLNLSIARDEHPDLFEELQKFSSNIKRIQRFKTLASERLLLTGRVLSTSAAVRQDAARTSESPIVKDDELAAVQELCLPPLK